MKLSPRPSCSASTHQRCQKKAVAAAGAEIGNLQRPLGGERAQPLDLAPQLGLGAGVEHVEIEAAHAAHRGARAQLVDDRQRRDLPHRRVRPRAGEAQLVLSVAGGSARIRAGGSRRAIP